MFGRVARAATDTGPAYLKVTYRYLSICKPVGQGRNQFASDPGAQLRLGNFGQECAYKGRRLASVVQCIAIRGPRDLFFLKHVVFVITHTLGDRLPLPLTPYGSQPHPR